MSPEIERLLEEEETTHYEDLIEDFDLSLTDIGSLNTVHDRYQFESKFDFDLTSEQTTQEKIYDVDLFFFIPKTMGINKDTYQSKDFYGDLTNYVRIRTPELSKKYSIKKDGQWSLPLLKRYFSIHLVTHKRQKLQGAVIQEVKLFGCFINTQLKNIHYNLLRSITKKPQSFLKKPRRIEVLTRRLEGLKAIFLAYREQYVQHIRNEEIFADDEVKRSLLLVDEYISYRLEAVLVRMCRLLEPHRDKLNDVLELMYLILSEETQYRIKVGIISLPESDENTQEYYYYRLSLLKKYVSDVLFLEINNIKKEKKYRNFVAAFGAAMAATAAGLSDVRMWQDAGQVDVGLRLVTVILLGVAAYVFKDRIKDWTKEYFNEKLKHYLPDFEMKMHYTHFDTQVDVSRHYLGFSREYVRYLKKENLPHDVRYLRDLGHNVELEPERNEVMIHYAKQFHFQSDVFRNQLKHVRFLKEIVRFDLSKFLAKLDEPQKKLRYFDSETGVMSMRAPKVYHINLILKYAATEKGDKSRLVELERIRLILNKKGIVRVETVIPRGEMNYLEELA